MKCRYYRNIGNEMPKYLLIILIQCKHLHVETMFHSILPIQTPTRLWTKPGQDIANI